MIHFQAKLEVPKMVELISGEKLASKLTEIANSC